MRVPAPLRARTAAALRRGALLVTVPVLCSLMAGAALAAPSATTAVADANRLAARCLAAADLLASGRAADAQALGDAIDRGARSLAAEGATSALREAARATRAALRAGDASAATRAAADASAAAVTLARTLEGDAPTGVVAALVRDAEREAAEAAAEGGAGSAAEPRAMAKALATQAAAVAHDRALPEAAVAALAALERGLAQQPLDAASVERSADAAIAALGAPPADDQTARYFETIRRDLDDAVTAYRSGDAASAEDHLIDAYLENFEYLEAPLEAVAPDLKEELEHTLRDDLRAMVRSGGSVDAFATAVRDALTSLSAAEEALR